LNYGKKGRAARDTREILIRWHKRMENANLMFLIGSGQNLMLTREKASHWSWHLVRQIECSVIPNRNILDSIYSAEELHNCFRSTDHVHQVSVESKLPEK
jgi:hypothetical protein